MPDCSIVIPVFNKWELTRNCLLGLSATLGRSAEIIIVDNASSDQTPHECPTLGNELFGDSFQYLRNETNRNFAGASNQGATLAKGEYLVFLNNDTEPQPGWLDPLLEDFNIYNNLAATGPLLVYPEETPLGKLVQHLGVNFSHFLHVNHLYQGIPAASPLAKKRRLFQAITAACMVIPRQLFLKVGKFDEGFINGFEDVDLCARLWHMGFIMTVNPSSLVIHHESQTFGRHQHEEKNSNRLWHGNLNIFVPDMHLYLDKDGLTLHVNEWLKNEFGVSAEVAKRLNTSFSKAEPEHLKKALCIHPFWKRGWERLLAATKNPAEKLALYRIFIKFFGNPQNLVPVCTFALKNEDMDLFNQCMANIKSYSGTPPDLLSKAESAKQWCSNLGLQLYVDKYDSWIHNYPTFSEKTYPRFARDLLNFIRKAQIIIPKATLDTYASWVQEQKD